MATANSEWMDEAGSKKGRRHYRSAARRVKN
jgi:hypothetical protein